VRVKSRAYLDEEALDLITRLLCVDETQRLGHGNEVGNYTSIKQHPWFASINWDGVEAGRYRALITPPKRLPVEPEVSGRPWTTCEAGPLSPRLSREKFGLFG
jgi:hypothetical protein